MTEEQWTTQLRFIVNDLALSEYLQQLDLGLAKSGKPEGSQTNRNRQRIEEGVALAANIHQKIMAHFGSQVR